MKKRIKKNEVVAPKPRSAPPEIDEELEAVRQQQFRQFRETLSPFWAWRVRRP